MTNKRPADFKGYSFFDEIKSPIVKAWNRLNTIYNMKEQGGNGLAIKYSELFDKFERIQILTLAVAVERDGYENVRRTIMREEFA